MIVLGLIILLALLCLDFILTYMRDVEDEDGL